MSKHVCITGMHRSGTSLVASWLEMCGVNLQNKLGPGTGNEIGHFEDTEILDLHNRAINRINPTSKGWIVNRSNRILFNEQELNIAKNIVFKRASNFGISGWKDPRSSLFLQQWKIVNPDMKTIILWRPYSNVIDSLMRRTRKAEFDVYKITYLQAAEVWSLYNKNILTFYKKNRNDSLLFSINELVKKDRLFFDIINTKLDLELSYSPISGLYKNNMFSEHNINNSLLKRIYFKFQGLDKIEAELIKYSSEI